MCSNEECVDAVKRRMAQIKRQKLRRRNGIVALSLAAAFCAGKKYLRFFLFTFAGMGACLISAYVNTFLAAMYGATAFNATAEIAPVVEEVIKLLPLLCYLLVFQPEREHIRAAVLTIAVGFATFENVCYLIQQGAGDLGFLLIRGFGTGAMHIVCGAIIGSGMLYVWRRGLLTVAGTCGLLGTAVIFHGIYNLLIAYGGWVQYVAYVLPVLVVLLGAAAGRYLSAFPKKNED